MRGGHFERSALIEPSQRLRIAPGPADADGFRQGVANLLAAKPDVSRERLIRAFAGERDFVALIVDRRREPQHRAAELSITGTSAAQNQIGVRVDDVFFTHRHHRQRRTERFRRFFRGGSFVGTGLVEADRERRHRFVALARTESQNDRRIQTAADITHHRHIAAQPNLDRAPHQTFQLVDQRTRIVKAAFVASVGEIEVPIAPQLDSTVFDFEKMTRRDRLHSFEHRPRRPGGEKRENMINALGIDPRFDQSRGQERLDFGTPQEPAVAFGIKEGANADAIATEDQGPLATVPKRNRELAARSFEHPLAAILV